MTIGEEQLERYVRFPESLSDEERRTIEQYIERNELAQQIVAFYSDFYEELDDLEESSPDAAALASFIVNRLCASE